MAGPLRTDNKKTEQMPTNASIMLITSTTPVFISVTGGKNRDFESSAFI